MEKPNLIIYGRFIALSPVEEIPSQDPTKPAMKKRKLYIDCTRYDSITGQRDERENKPLLEFGGDKVCQKLAALNLQKDDIVCVSFAIQGVPTKDKTTGKAKVFTSIRCYDCEVVRRAGEPVAPAPAAPSGAQALQQSQAFQQQPVQTTTDGTDGLPF